MCGIAGFVTRQGWAEEELRAIVGRMADQLVHRGPDDSGTWADPSWGVALGSRRLAIQDLSPAGHQPMASPCGRYVMVFNGEVYNFRSLREELEPQGFRFRGHSDTEVMLAAISEWGLEAAVKRFIGMFAFALWDRQECTLSLVRDRLGIKPLYYGWAGKTFLFGSELKALRIHPDFACEVDRDALALLLALNYIPHPYSIYKAIHKLGPGCLLRLRLSESQSFSPPAISAYWSAQQVAESGAANRVVKSEEDAATQLDALLREAVRLRMIADVPLGAFLSGGIDSSTVVALMQAQSNRPVKTFTIGFREAGYDEAPQAKAVAGHLGTDHTELYVTPAESLAVIPKLPHLFDEPFSDSSQIPTYLVSALARRHVTVSMSGDGGDELFGGYTRYLLVHRLWRSLGWLPRFSRRALAGLITSLRPSTYDRYFSWLGPWLNGIGRPGPVGDKLYKLAGVLPAESPEALYCHFITHWKRPAELVVGVSHAPNHGKAEACPRLPDFYERMMFLDLVTYLPDDILTKVDRASMGVSLEARVPLLDHRIVEFAARLPLSMKIRQGQGKWLLRQVLRRYLPAELVRPDKMGFGVPLDDWLRGPLKEWAEALLDEHRLRQEGFFRPEPVRALWTELLAGLPYRAEYLWDVLMFQAWYETWG